SRRDARAQVKQERHSYGESVAPRKGRKQDAQYAQGPQGQEEAYGRDGEGEGVDVARLKGHSESGSGPQHFHEPEVLGVGGQAQVYDRERLARLGLGGGYVCHYTAQEPRE